MAVKSYRDLIAWQRGMDLAVEVYEATTDWPDAERFGLISQIRRAAVSIPSYIAEGHGRRSDPEFRHFLGIAHGSLCELETCFLFGRSPEIQTSLRGGDESRFRGWKACWRHLPDHSAKASLSA
jgi:four helix bundle protein